MEPSPLFKRVSRLRMPKSELAKRARLHENTVKRALLPEPRTFTSTQQQLERIVSAEELDLRDYLLGVHPLDTEETRG